MLLPPVAVTTVAVGVEDRGVDSSESDALLESPPLEVLKVLQSMTIDDTDHALATVTSVGVGTLLTVEENRLVLQVL